MNNYFPAGYKSTKTSQYDPIAVYLRPDQIRALKLDKVNTGNSVSETVRELIDTKFNLHAVTQETVTMSDNALSP